MNSLNVKQEIRHAITFEAYANTVCCASFIRHAEFRSQFYVLEGGAMARSYATTKDRRK